MHNGRAGRTGFGGRMRGWPPSSPCWRRWGRRSSPMRPSWAGAGSPGRCSRNAPPGKMAGPVTVKASEVPKMLGYLELGQRSGAKSAAAEHLRDRAATINGCSATSRRTSACCSPPRAIEARFAERWTIAEGDRISLPGVDLDVVKLSADSITLREAKSGREMTWEGKVVPKDEPLTEVCHGGLRRAINSAKWSARNMMPSRRARAETVRRRRRRQLLRPLEDGGAGARGGVHHLAGGQVPGLAGRHAHRDAVDPQGREGPELRRHHRALDGELGRVESMVVGITRYRVEAKPDSADAASRSSTGSSSLPTSSIRPTR